MHHLYAHFSTTRPDAVVSADGNAEAEPPDRATEVKRLVNKKLRFEATVAVFGQSPPGGG
jgi:hypothetical protein